MLRKYATNRHTTTERGIYIGEGIFDHINGYTFMAGVP
jgi:hypothetical protein